MTITRTTHWLPASIAASFLFFTCQSAHAVVTSAASDGYGLLVDLSAFNALTGGLDLQLTAGPSPSGADGIAPGPYNVSDSDVDLNVIASGTFYDGFVVVDSLNASAQSNVDGLSGIRTTTASGGVADANIGVLIPDVVTALSLTDVIASSTAQVTGEFGSLVPSGSSTIDDLGVLRIAGILVDLSAFVGVNIPANTSINLAALGIANSSLVLNEQIVVGNNEITVNAFHLQLDLAGIDGSVIIGHSHALMRAIPEPSTLSLSFLGLLALSVGRRRLVLRAT